MNRRAILIVVVSALVVAAAVLWFVRSRGSDESTPAPAVVDAPAKATDSGGPNSSSAGRGGRDATMRVLADDDPEGDLRLEGQVIDDTESPVAGARVTIDSNPPRSTTSEEDGSFYFDKLVGRRYWLVATAEAGVAGPVQARLTSTSDPVVLRLTAGASVQVSVVAMGSGEPVAGASVELRGVDRQASASGQDGVARFDQVVPGGYDVVARAPGFAMETGRVAVSRGAAEATVTLELRRGARVAGRVVEPGGAPAAGARVSFEGASEWGLRSDPRLDAEVTDDAGRFAFDALPAGSFRLTARSDKHAPGSSDLLTLDGTSEVTGVVIELEPAAVVRGLVVSAGGEPVGGAQIRAQVSGRGMIQRGPARQAFADDRGKFEIVGLPRKDLDLVALHDSATSEIVAVDLAVSPYERELTLKLDVDGVIAGVVVDTAGEPLEAAQVSAFPDFRRSGAGPGRGMWLRGLPAELTDAGGRFEIRGLDEMPYRLRAAPAGSSARDRMWLDEGVEANVGDREIRIVLPADGAVVGKVAFEDGEPPAMFTVSVGWRRGTPFSSEDGSFKLSGLPPQTFTVSIQGAGFDVKQIPDVRVSEGETADLGTITVTKGRTISGRVTGPDGRAVEGALVRAGRYVFGDGSSAKAQGGPPQARNAKEATTDDTGQFTIYGVGRGDLSVVAEHQAIGRSQAVQLLGSRDSVVDLGLALVGFGVLEGRVVGSDGAALGDVVVNAASLTSPAVSFAVATGADGRFRFDRLAADEYRVSAMTGQPMTGLASFSKPATVVAGQTTEIELVVEGGQIKLVVEMVDKGGGDVGFVWVTAARGALSAATGRELFAKVGAMGESSVRQAFAIFGRPAQVIDLSAGDYTLCAVPYPTEVQGMGDTLDYMEREGDNLPVFCKRIAVDEAPLEQKAQLQLSVPDYVPPPG